MSSTESDQSRVRTSMPNRLVSDGSEDLSPVSLYSTQSLHQRFVAPLPTSSGWFSSRHLRTAQVDPAYGPPPVVGKARETVPSAYQPSMMSPARPSVQRMAWSYGSPLAS